MIHDDTDPGAIGVVMRHRVGLALLCLLLAACQWGTAGSGAGGSIDGLRYQGVLYARDGGVPSTLPGVRALTEADLGPELGRVSGSRAGEPEGRRELGELEATGLPDGTPVHSVNGYPTAFRLAARLDGEVALYEPWWAPSARVGADLVAIGGKVREIAVSRTEPPRRLGAVDDPAEVDRLVRALLEAPLLERPSATDPDVRALTFHLADGTGVTRLYDTRTGELWVGTGALRPPAAFAEAIRAATAAGP
jgi:hypothetical protein